MSLKEKVKTLFFDIVAGFLTVVCRVFYKLHRLEKIDLVELKTPLSKAIDLYGQPFETESREDFPESTIHKFEVGLFHEAIITEWQGLIHSITYWSSYSSPSRDLKCMLENYSEGNDWHEYQKGYYYNRNDMKVKLWCSAAPAIGVGSFEFFEAKTEYIHKKSAT